MANRLSQEKSPYLLQHADNPVEWYPWADEALARARAEDKPIFLSIGYATCHWCHVMAHECFEDREVAGLLNDDFVAIKVDREERPDLDQVYMNVSQVMSGGGGWPLNVFLTPEGKPFFSGTYFPKQGRGRMPGFIDVLTQIAHLWHSDRARLVGVGEEITRAVQAGTAVSGGARAPDSGLLALGYKQLQQAFDPQWGGFGRAPKFPTPHHLTFLLRWYARTRDQTALVMAEKTLDAMRNGGIFDQIGWGFCRYSVDEQWLAPHFEKMLYDQALLALAYVEARAATGCDRHGQVAREILAYVARRLTAPEGGFYSAEDADSEGREGWFYLWTPAEIEEVLGPITGKLFCRFYDITAEGNFEHGRSIPRRRLTSAAFAEQENLEVEAVDRLLAQGRDQLFAAREKRVHPFLDDKILTSWNGLMIAALARGHQVLGDEQYLRVAATAADFILDKLVDASGRLLRRYRHGQVAVPGYLDDYAFLVWGLLELYEASFEARYLKEAIRLNHRMLDLFGDEQDGGLFFTARDNEALIVRDKDLYDGAVPSANSVAALNLLRLSRLTGDPGLERRADRLLAAFAGKVAEYPMAYTQFLQAIDFSLGPGREIVVAGEGSDPDTRALLTASQRAYLPNRVLLFKASGPAGDSLAELSPFTRPLAPQAGRPTVFLCENRVCQPPITSPEELAAWLAERVPN